MTSSSIDTWVRTVSDGDNDLYDVMIKERCKVRIQVVDNPRESIEIMAYAIPALIQLLTEADQKLKEAQSWP